MDFFGAPTTDTTCFYLFLPVAIPEPTVQAGVSATIKEASKYVVRTTLAVSGASCLCVLGGYTRLPSPSGCYLCRRQRLVLPQNIIPYPERLRKWDLPCLPLREGNNCRNRHIVPVVTCWGVCNMYMGL